MSYKRRLVTSSGTPRRILGSLLILLTFAITISVLEFTNVTHFFHKNQPHHSSTPTVGGASANEQKGEPRTSGSSSSSGAQSGNNQNNGNSTPRYLATPTGNFVSNHKPGQNGSPLTEASSCNTSRGATCQILFTKDGVTKSLPTQLTDISGSTFWDHWTPQQYGLTTGSWQVRAVATLDGQTKSATDAMPLEVSP